MKRLITTALIGAIAVLLLVHYILGTDYLRQRREHEALADQINQAAQALAQTPAPPPDLENRLAAARANLAASQSALPQELNSTLVINAILELADACQVKAIPLETRPWSVENTGGGYHVFRLDMTVRGNFSQVTDFITQLENGEAGALVIEKLDITRGAAPPQETTPVMAGLGLAIYVPVTTAK